MRRILALIYITTTSLLFSQVDAPEIDLDLSSIKVFDEDNLLIHETRTEIDYEAGVYTELYYAIDGSNKNYSGKQVSNFDTLKNVTRIQFFEAYKDYGDYSLFFYDNDKQLIREEKYYAGGALAGPVIYLYDDVGNQISAEYYYADGDKSGDFFANEIMEYDNNGYMIKMTSYQYGVLDQIIEFDFNNNYKSVEISLFNPEGEKVRTDIETYLLNGEIEKRVQAAGTEDEITVFFYYDQKNRLSERLAVDSTGGQLQRIEYQY